MNVLPFMAEYAPARTVSLPELYDLFKKNKKVNNRSDANNYKKASNLLIECFPNENTGTFSTASLIQFQNYLVEKGYERKYCNKLVSFVRSIFKWGFLTGVVSPVLVGSLKLIPPVQIGTAKENKRRTNIPQEDLEVALPFFSEIIADMLRLQMLSAMRPSEVCRMKAEHIVTEYDGKNWLYLPPKHKTAWRGKERVIILGLEEQEIIKKYLKKDTDKNIFLNTKGNPYTGSALSQEIRKKIKKNNLPKFTAYQLRHTKLTEVSAEHGRDAARAVAGHSTENITGVYDHSDIGKFKAVIDSRNRKVVNATDQPQTALKIFIGEY
jgi:integrase